MVRNRFSADPVRRPFATRTAHDHPVRRISRRAAIAALFAARAGHVLVAVIAAGAFFLSPVEATAGSYLVHSCRAPDGSPASTVGWQAQGEGDVVTPDGCSGGGSLSVAFRDGFRDNTRFSGSWGQWVFESPADTRIAAYTVFRHVKVHLGASPREASEYKHFFENYIWQFSRDYCNPTVCRQLGTNPGIPRDQANAFQAEGLSIQRIGFVLECWRSDAWPGCPSWWEPVLNIYAADITLLDTHAPAILGLAGDLTGELRGTRPIVVRGMDRGGGLQRVQLEVDGTVVVDQAFDPRSVSCVRPYRSPVPCPLSGESHVPLDTSQLADGPHHLRAVVTDAAGNQAASPLYVIDVDNAGATCAYGHTARLRARFLRSGRTRIRLRAGRRATIIGRLRSADGQPIPGAALRVLVRPQHQTDYHDATAVTTGGKGRFRLALPANSSRRLRLAYCSPAGGAVRHLRMAAEATSSIRANRRRLRNGQAVILFGRLRGRHVPSSGKLVEIQAFFRSRWRTISSTRSSRKGEWRFRYRFDGTRGRVVYRFRVLLPREGGYPYASGTSSEIRLVVIGP
jgi:hypothetical protein